MWVRRAEWAELSELASEDTRYMVISLRWSPSLIFGRGSYLYLELEVKPRRNVAFANT